MSNTYHFSFVSAYQGDVDYDVYNRATGKKFRASLRTQEPDREHLSAHYTEDVYTREILPTIGKLRNHYAGNITSEIINAFNTWRMEQFTREIREMTARHPALDVAGFIAPQPVTGIYWTEDSWHDVD